MGDPLSRGWALSGKSKETGTVMRQKKETDAVTQAVYSPAHLDGLMFPHPAAGVNQGSSLKPGSQAMVLLGVKSWCSCIQNPVVLGATG